MAAPSMTQRCDMFNGLQYAAVVVDRDVADELIRRAEITEDDANSRLGQRRSSSAIDRRCHDGDAANIAFDKLANYGLRAGPAIFGVQQQNIETQVPGSGQESADNLGK